jgi:hypothetical protein
MDRTELKRLQEGYAEPRPEAVDVSAWVRRFLNICAPAHNGFIHCSQGTAFLAADIGDGLESAAGFEDAADVFADKIAAVLGGVYGKVLDATWLVGQFAGLMSRILHREVRWDAVPAGAIEQWMGGPDVACPAAKKWRIGEASAQAVGLLHHFVQKVACGDRNPQP